MRTEATPELSHHATSPKASKMSKMAEKQAEKQADKIAKLEEELKKLKQNEKSKYWVSERLWRFN